MTRRGFLPFLNLNFGKTASRRIRQTQVDRDFVKLMNKAEQTQIVLNCCANELLKNTLPVLYDELERCHLGVPRRCLHFNTTRVHLTSMRVVSFSSLRPFGPL